MKKSVLFGLTAGIAAVSAAVFVGKISKEIKNDLSETNVDILATVEQGKGEVLEIDVPESFKEQKLMDLKLPVKAIIAIIQRRNKVIIPKGDTLVMPKDTLIIFTTKDNSIELKKYFKV